ncbi:hypothetical protein [Lysobacter gummosus]
MSATALALYLLPAPFLASRKRKRRGSVRRAGVPLPGHGSRPSGS